MEFSFIVPEKYSGLMAQSRRHHFFSSFYALSGKYRNAVQVLAARGDLLILEAGYSSYLPADVDRIEALERMICDLRNGCLVVVLPFDDPHANVTWLDTGIGSISGSIAAMLLLKGSDLGTVTLPLPKLLAYNPSTIEVTWIGLAKELETIADGNLGGRARVLDVYAPELEAYNLWLAGMYRDPAAEIRLASQQAIAHGLRIRGADSTKLWRLCSQGRAFTEASPYPEPFDFRQTDVSPVFIEFAESQFDSFRREIAT